MKRRAAHGAGEGELEPCRLSQLQPACLGRVTKVTPFSCMAPVTLPGAWGGSRGNRPRQPSQPGQWHATVTRWASISLFHFIKIQPSSLPSIAHDFRLRRWH